MGLDRLGLLKGSRTFASTHLLRPRPQTRSYTSGYARPVEPPQPDSQTIKVADNRLLGFAEYGDLLAGVPIFYFHGLPASRLDCAAWNDFISNRIRLISIDRPGIGLSTFQPDRKILDWPTDVLRLADRLNIDTFRVLGVSGGGPYALACAYALPQDRLKGVGVLAGIAPWHAATEGMRLGGRIRWNAAALAPALYSKIWWAFHVRDAQDPDPKRWYARQEKNMKVQGMNHQSVYQNQNVRIAQMESQRPAFVQGLDGLIHDLRLLTSSWGFDLEDIKFEGVRLWYGGNDTNYPAEMGRYMAARLRGSKLSIYPNETHDMMTGTRARVKTILRGVIGKFYSGCEICGRRGITLTRHHLIPQSVQASRHRPADLAMLCKACHVFVHKMASNKDLASEYSTVDLILEREDVQRFASWVGNRW